MTEERTITVSEDECKVILEAMIHYAFHTSQPYEVSRDTIEVAGKFGTKAKPVAPNTNRVNRGT